MSFSVETMFGAPMRLSIVSIAALIVSLLSGFLISEAGQIAPLLGLPMLVGRAPPSISPQIIHGIVIAIGVYGVLAAVLITVAISDDLRLIREQLISLIATGKAEQMKAGDWHLVFFGALAEPLGFRLISIGNDAENKFFCVSAPFSPSNARREVWRFYQQNLIRCQAWTALGCLVLGALVIFFSEGSETFQTMESVLPLLGGAALGICVFIAASFLAANEFIERFVDTLSSFPFKLEASLRMDVLTNRLEGNQQHSAELRRIPTERTELAIPSSRGFADSIATIDPMLFRTWIESAATSLMGAIDQKIVPPLQIAENFLAASSASSLRLDERLEAISQALHDGFLGQREDILRSIDAAHVNSRESVQQLAAALHALLEEISQRRSERPNQNSIDLAASTETLSDLFLPALKSLETMDGRLLDAVERQEKVLDQLGLFIKELTGTLAARETILNESNGSMQQPSAAYIASVNELQDEEAAESDEILTELRSLLYELDDASMKTA